MPRRDQHPAMVPEDGDEGAGLDERVAEQKLIGGEKNRQDRVFERAKKRRRIPITKSRARSAVALPARTPMAAASITGISSSFIRRISHALSDLSSNT